MTIQTNLGKTQLLASIEALSEKVSAERHTFDRDRRMPDDIIDELAHAGLFRLWLPARYGGAALSPADFQDVVEAAAALDGSIGWLVGNGGGMSRAGGYLPEATARAMFADPKAFVVSATGATGRAVPTGSGFRITGHWPFGSGAHHGTYFAVVCEVADDRAPGQGRRILAYVPRSAVSILDTWQVSGLRATGSCDLAMEDIEVESGFAHDFQPVPTAAGDVYRLPAISAFSFTVATVPLGIAAAARRAFVALATDHKRFGKALALAQSELIQSEVGRIDARSSAARGLLRQSIQDLCAEVARAPAASEAARLAFRAACALAGETAAVAVSSYCDMAGARAIFENSTLERCERDVRAAVKHVAMSPAVYVTGGMATLGLDISTRRF